MADEMTKRDAKLVQYLNEAFGKEKELEAALTAHIKMTTRPPYKKRLQEHLRETKAHARNVQRRIKKLGGKAQALPVLDPVSEVSTAVAGVASKAVAAAKGPLHAVRGTGEQEKMLKNVKTEYSREHEEIATYMAIETLADSLGDKETAKLARDIRREEERMARFLERQIPPLTKAVMREEIPAAERRADSGRRRTGTTSSRGTAGGRTRRTASTTRARTTS
jgi:ferritin-like metal-binding protein YciE